MRGKLQYGIAAAMRSRVQATSWASGVVARVEQFRTIQDLLSTHRDGSVIVSILRTRCKSEGDMSMSICWACGGAPPSWSFVCEECGGRGVSSEKAHEEMERVERDYWRGSVGQYSNPFRSRPPALGFIAPAIPNPILFCG